ncbi:MAG: PAS domain-containing protein [Acidobacteriaceae bacterium]
MSKQRQSNIADQVFAGGGETAALLRKLDWSKTPLGPVEQWPQSLKTAVSICLNSRFAIVVWWGTELVYLYNDAYRPLIGAKHPRALGRPMREVLPEIWATIGPLAEAVMQRGESSWSEDMLLLLERNGYAEECNFTFSFSPIRDESGGVGGIFVPVVETTEKVVNERRLQTLRALAEAGAGESKSVREACGAAAAALSSNPYDIPFAAIYLFVGPPGDDSVARLAASTTAGAEPMGFPGNIDFRDRRWFPFKEVAQGRMQEIDLTTADIGMPPLAPWGSPPVEAVAVPIVQPEAKEPIGFLLAGVNARKRLDDEYRKFYFQVAAELFGTIREAHTLERESALRSKAEAEWSKIRELFLSAPAAIAVLSGPTHIYTLANEAYVKLLSRSSAKELIGKPVIEVLPELREQGIVEILDDVYCTGVPFIGSELLIHLDIAGSGKPSDVFFNFVFQAIRDHDGEIEGIFVLALDITSQVIARQQIEMREQQFRVLADSIPQMAWMANPDGYITWYNRRWYDYTGTTLEQMEGWGWQSVHDPQLLPKVMARYRRSIETGEPFDMEFPLRGADGKFRTFLTRALPVRDAAGTIVHWFGTNTDVEGEHRAAAALRQSEKLAAVGRLASSIAHEINNPLEAVTNLIFLARSGAVDNDVKLFLQSAQQELQRVSQITNQTLRFHKQQSAPSATEISEVFDSILTLYRGRLLRDGIEVKVTAEECPPLICYAGELRQVLANLVGNALDAMPKGGTLRLRMRSATDWRSGKPGIRITVADTGIGMPPDVQRRIYEPFFTTKGETGTGLGLWVSAGIVDKHGGSLHVRSSAVPGASWTAFTLILPMDGATARAETEMSANSEFTFRS